MKIKIRRGQDKNSNYYAMLKIFGDDPHSFRPFALPSGVDNGACYEISVDAIEIRELDEYVPRKYGKMLYGKDYNLDCGFSDKIKLVSKSIVRLQRAVEYIIELVQQEYKDFVEYRSYYEKCKSLWDDPNDREIMLYSY